MGLQSGARLGPYEILAPLGSGGMGEVYKARDTKLHRDVAIKVLPDLLARDSERLARFEREAQALAALNHPNIAALYGFEDSNGTPALILELIDGESLATRLDRGQIEIDEAMEICRQISTALEAAHEKGILHRDLKPANIQIASDGRVKVLDFGLAKIFEPGEAAVDVSRSPTLTTPLHTAGGVILGTAAYMSPEQARGHTVDQRSDVWAFGCVLFEVLTGQQAFRGDTVTDILAAIVRSEPDWTQLPSATPTIVRSLLRQCLQKQPKRRLHEIADARVALDDAIEQPQPATSGVASSPPPPDPSWHRVASVIGISLVSMMVGAIAVWGLNRRAPEPVVVTRLSMGVQPADQLGRVEGTSTRPSRTAIALSPDGRTMVFSGTKDRGTQLFVRPLAQADATPIPGSEGGIGPFFSPNGQWIGFWADGKLKKAPLAGGPAVVICATPVNWFGGSWGDHDTIVFAARTAATAERNLFTVPAGGGTPQAVANSETEDGAAFLPQWLPDEAAVLYTVRPPNDFESEQVKIVVQTANGERHTIVDGATDARYVSSDHLIYLRMSTLMAVPFDRVGLRVTGSPVALIDNVMQALNTPNGNNETGAGQLAVSKSGTLAYVSGGISPPRRVVMEWVDRRGVETPLKQEPGPYVMPRISPDGSRLAYNKSRDATSRALDLWLYDIKRESTLRLTSEGSNNAGPVWSPDSQRILYTRGGAAQNLTLIPIGGSPSVQEITANVRGSSWISAGNILAAVDSNSSLGQLSVISMDGDHKARPFSPSQFAMSHPVFSPDGHWIAYVSSESGAREVYVQPYPGPGEKHRISTEGGIEPLWSHSGRELFYRQPKPNTGQLSVVAVDMNLIDGFKTGRPHVLFEGPYVSTAPVRNYDISPDDQRFIMVKSVVDLEPPPTVVNVVLNWQEELKQRVPTR